jgi:hypothetical protein
MKQEQEEKTIKELFQRLKQEDERRAPSFADSWAAARSRLETRAQSVRARASNLPRWSLAVVAAILIAFGFIVYRATRDEPQKANSVITEKPPAPKLSVERKEQVVKEKLGPRPGSRSPSPKRHKWPPLNAPLITDSLPVYAMRGEYATEFVPVSYDGSQKPMESGEVIRLQMSRSALIAFGLPLNVEHADAPVKAELLLGEDGMARAIRFVR